MNRKFTIFAYVIFLGLLFFPTTSFCTNHDVNVQSYSFTPANLNVTVGDTVTWHWVNGVHTTTCDGSHTGTSLPPGADPWDAPMTSADTIFSYVVNVEGEYDYICIYHYPTMVGTITATALPVELVSFNGALSGDVVNLSWQTATEKNNKGFEVQRKNGSSWDKIGFVQGHGTTIQKNEYSYKDNIGNLTQKDFTYRLKQIDYSGLYEYSSEITINNSSPSNFSLSQNYPNPFNPSTQISYTLSQNSDIQLKVYDALGKEIATLVNSKQAAGKYEVTFDASKLSSGIYYYTITAGSFNETRKMILMK
ncbi:MAG TPA: T9SS type A sorting domain-containing protein [Ignavibacteriaceae bacterium]|nr:T9SS type A sorting domain-containing protein [Ignavibacteriaceae bacterium]